MTTQPKKKVEPYTLWGIGEREIWLDTMTILLYKQPKKFIRELLRLNCQPFKKNISRKL